MVGPHGQVIGSEKDIAGSFDRANGHTRSVVPANVQVTIAENLHARMGTVESVKNSIEPPAPPFEPGLAISVALPASEVSLNIVSPLKKKPLPVLPLAINTALSAVALSKKLVKLPKENPSVRLL